MVGLDRFELSTSRLSGVRSNQLSYRPCKLQGALFRHRSCIHKKVSISHVRQQVSKNTITCGAICQIISIHLEWE